MGFPLPNICTGLLPVLIVNIAISLNLVKRSVHSFLQSLGLIVHSRSPNDTASTMFPQQYNPTSGLLFPCLIEDILQALPLSVYNPDKSNYAMKGLDSECPVCLSGFKGGQELRVVPLCKHTFHKDCLDQWLGHQRTTCPLCRASLVPDDLVQRQRQREQELLQEVMVWLSSFHGAGFEGLWCHV